ncbi:uncharacterized protein LOC141706094 [Apium graveolens]|uniref:uncharacterized protein LOC141706094 n=1 Tax=Apium graveolens TaxID=4045 RepID=UPI003D7A8B26
MEDLSAKELEDILDDGAGYSFYALQSILVAREIYNHKMQMNKELEVKYESCVKKLEIVENLAKERLVSLNNSQKEFDDFSNKVQSMEQDMCSEAEKVVYQQIMRTRVDMMLEYHRGEWNSWDVLETVKIYNEAFPDDAFPLDEFNSPDDDTGMKSPKDGDPDDA